MDDGSGVPGLWVAEVSSGALRTRAAQLKGRTADLLRPARELVSDPLLETARAENPLPGT